MISKKQVALIHVAKARLCMQDDDYKALLLRVAGVQSSVQLDARGFEAVLAEFGRLGFEAERPNSAAPVPFSGVRPGMLTNAQAALIRSLWAEYKGTPQQDDAALGRWLDHSFGISALRFVLYEDARRIVAALKAMKKRQRAKAQATNGAA
jgi:hypothetical protein